MGERLTYRPVVPEKTHPRHSELVSESHEIKKLDPETSSGLLSGEIRLNDFASKAGLTRHSQTPYAKDGSTIFMSDTKGGDIQQPHTEAINPVGDGSIEQQLANEIAATNGGNPPFALHSNEQQTPSTLHDILTRSAAAESLPDGDMRSHMQVFDEAVQKNPLSNEKAWPTDKLKQEYRAMHGFTLGNRIKAKLGIGKVGLTEQDRQQVALHPRTRMILHELSRRQEDVPGLIREVAGAEEKALKKQESTKQNPDATGNPLRQILQERQAKPERDEVLKNAADTDHDRMEKAWKILSENGIDPSSLSEHQKDLLEEVMLVSHDEGDREIGKDGSKAGIYNFTREQLRKKAEMLDAVGLTDPKVRRALMEAGIVGTGDAMDGERVDGSRRNVEWTSDSVYNPSRPEGSSSAPIRRPELLRAWQTYWEQQNPGMEMSDEVIGQIWSAANRGAWPPGYTPGRVPDQPLILDPRQRFEAGQRRGEEAPRVNPQAIRDGAGHLYESDPEMAGRIAHDQARRDDPNNPTYVDDPRIHQQAPQPSMDENYVSEMQSDRDRALSLRDDTDPGYREVGYGNEVKVSSVEVLAEEIMKFDGADKWGTAGVRDLEEDGEFPLLRKVFDENGKQKTFKQRVKKGKEWVEEEKPLFALNEENFMRWVREKMMYWHNRSPDEVHDFGQKVALVRDFSQISLQQMLTNYSRYFRSTARDGEILHGLVDQIERETWLFGSSRATDIEYRQLMGSDEDLPKTITKLFYGNTFTKSVWGGKSGMYWIMTLPEHFRDVTKKGGQGEIDGDSRVGRALNMAYHVYYNISDKERLIELLGPGTALLDPKKLEDRLKKQAKDEGIDWEGYIEPKLLSDMRSDPEAFMGFINIFNQNGKPTRIVKAVRSIVQDEIGERFNLKIPDVDPDTGVTKTKADGSPEMKLDTTSIQYADTFAFSMMRWTGGAARNDVGAQGYDAWTRVQITDEYRKKQPVNSRGGSFGNPYNINFMKQVGTDFLTGTQVQNSEKFDGKGKPVPKSTLQVMEEMQKAGANDKAYQDASSQLVFTDNTMRGFAIDHLGRAFSIFQQLQGAEEIKLDKFTHFDPVSGLTFERAAFEEALKEKFFKPMRYGYSTYGQINFGKMVRSPYNAPKRDSKGRIVTDEKGNMEFDVKYRDMRLAEAMFGREIIDGLGHEFFNHGKEKISMDDANWADKINWEKINSTTGKRAIWRQVALGRIAAELYAHRDFHSTDPKYTPWYYEEVIEVLELLPNVIWGDETDMQGSKAMGHFFSHHDIDWLRKAASIERWKIFRNMLINDIFKGGYDGLKKGLQLYYKAVVY